MSGTSHTTGFRRGLAGVGLIGFPLAGLVAAVLDSGEGTETPGSELYAIAAAHGDAILASAVVFVVSAILTVPAAVGVLHLVRDRGATVAHVGVVLTVLGGFGHMGFASWQMIISQVPSEADEPAMVAFLDRQQSVMTTVLLPLLIAVGVGMLLMVIALFRAGLVDRWFLNAMIALFAFDVVLNSTELESSKAAIVAVWAGLTLLLGHFGVRVLRMSDTEWANEPQLVH